MSAQVHNVRIELDDEWESLDFNELLMQLQALQGKNWRVVFSLVEPISVSSIACVFGENEEAVEVEECDNK